ncbi:MAG: SCO family protein [candidate division NC10 bacterium]|nr:SCO family protein [candidate division NC10 bacterium]
MRDLAFNRRRLGMSLLVLALAGILATGGWISLGPRPGLVGRDEHPLEGLQIFWAVPDFSLVERSGRQVTLADLRGKVWIANFIYSHCTDTCPLQSAEMARLQADLALEPDVRLVSFTVDPEQDTADVLAEYAARFGADRDRWLFLTGEKRAIYTLARAGFRLNAVDPAEAVKAPPGKGSPPDRPLTDNSRRWQPWDGTWAAAARILSHAVGWSFEPAPAQAHPGHPGKPFMHSSLFVLVDRHAQVRGYYHSDDHQALARLRQDVRVLLREE